MVDGVDVTVLRERHYRSYNEHNILTFKPTNVASRHKPMLGLWCGKWSGYTSCDINWSRYKQQVPEIRQYIILCTQAVVLA
jgi:hypothetical protein